MDHKLNDALLNCGLPQFTNAIDYSKDDIKVIIKQLNNLKNYYVDGFVNSDTYKTLKSFINNYCVGYRWYSLIIQ